MGSMDEPGGHCAQRNEPATQGQILQGSTEMLPGRVSSTKTETEGDGGHQGWEEADGESAFHGDRVSVWDGDRDLETDGMLVSYNGMSSPTT